MKKILAAMVLAVLLAASCNEPSPDEFPAPEFGKVEVNLNGLAGTVQCEVRNAADGLSYGFILKTAGSSQEIDGSLSGGMLKAGLDGLTPASEYNIQAFATNGVNQVLSEAVNFKTEEQGTFAIIPDPVFKRLILREYDKNGDSRLSLEEAERISNLNFCTDSISSLEGIEYFPNLQSLTCCGSVKESRTGQLTRIDLRQNPRLRSVEADGNRLKEMLLPEGYSDIEEIPLVSKENF